MSQSPLCLFGRSISAAGISLTSGGPFPYRSVRQRTCMGRSAMFRNSSLQHNMVVFMDENLSSSIEP